MLLLFSLAVGTLSVLGVPVTGAWQPRRAVTTCDIKCNNQAGAGTFEDHVASWDRCMKDCEWENRNKFSGRNEEIFGSRFDVDEEIFGSRFGVDCSYCNDDPDPVGCYVDCRRRRSVEGRNEEIFVSRFGVDCTYCNNDPDPLGCLEDCRRRRSVEGEVMPSKPFWEQNVFLVAVIFAVIASVAGLTYRLYEKKKKVKQVSTDGHDSVYTSITA